MIAPELSMVVSCYFEEKTIDEFYARLQKALASTGRTYEMVFVNDGSTDGTWERLKAIHAKDPHVTVIDLFRNAGQAAALTAGIARAQGEAIGFMDSDLQLDPEDLPKLLARFDEDLDVASGMRAVRQDSLGRKIAALFRNRVVRRVTGHRLQDFGCTFKIYRGDLLRAFDLGPLHPLQQAYVLRAAGRVGEVEVNHHPRRHGRSGWTLRRLLTLHLDHLLGAYHGVFQWVSLLAFLVAGLTLLRIVVAWFAPAGSILAGPVTTGLILNAMLLATAFLLGVLALIGEYVIRTWARTQRVPRYVVREILEPRHGD